MGSMGMSLMWTLVEKVGGGLGAVGFSGSVRAVVWVRRRWVMIDSSE